MTSQICCGCASGDDSMDQSDPCKTESVQETHRGHGKFFRPEGNQRSIHTDNSLGFMTICEELNPHEKYKPRRSETHGTAERPLRRVKEGMSPVLVQFGPWTEAMKFDCYLRNVQTHDKMVGHLVNVGSVPLLYLQQTKVECIISARKSFL